MLSRRSTLASSAGHHLEFLQSLLALAKAGPLALHEVLDLVEGGFLLLAEQVPGAMIRLGTGIPGDDVRHDLHQSNFDVDERAIGYGVRVMVHTALASLSTGAF